MRQLHKMQPSNMFRRNCLSGFQNLLKLPKRFSRIYGNRLGGFPESTATA